MFRRISEMIFCIKISYNAFFEGQKADFSLKLMARAKRLFIPGYIWHITHGCHKREFPLKFKKDRYHATAVESGEHRRDVLLRDVLSIFTRIWYGPF